MKRLRILIEEDLNAALERRAFEEKTSKSALIRRYLRQQLRPLPPLSADPLMQMAGVDDFEPASVDTLVYLEPSSS